ncbi:protein COFACTOR ASSEMBLY OF COMPLEX C SUBUNIT B CCB4, chloroplastic isoform X2 [Amborella trichopoda]|uniref:protein COFACTOR ASSEMBLY OF COMPLEX C SUBUNIT B CCB4, chloroplastic isoform X2 n=1 Tax=Amborella trichopoda TaxID=13333 RepID=UPI0009BF2CC7|nr:protein COFACTOR ASSEMBLY OF COMPLEX C SUBUNIT B CCB4, chloroplastic isoform X2 [Amborella trichopoda]|eukprot:XP_020525826.1 protein COFACTOR ASSEMBLY OF COMPLEX C SUBUNIT B CCB4, chloroplastic isoform X2 [Amborella trichopoda]
MSESNAFLLLSHSLPCSVTKPRPLFHHRPLSRTIRASSGLQGGYRGPIPNKDSIAEWVYRSDDTVRSAPIYVGGISLLAVLLNRAFSGVSPVADASSSQSRTDILTLALAVTNILAGLVWLSVKPKVTASVSLDGVECRRVTTDFPADAVAELLWVWDSLEDVTCCKSLVIVYENKCLLQIGVAAKSSASDANAVFVDPSRLISGSLYQGVKKSGKQSYLANLSLYPGRYDLPFFPPNTQSVILQPLGKDGMMIVGGDKIRGFTVDNQVRKAGINWTSGFKIKRI